MNNEAALKQARDGIAFKIAESPWTVTVKRVALVDNGFGGQVPNPYGTTTDYSFVGRVSQERSAVPQATEYPTGLDTSLARFLLAPYTADVRKDETFTFEGRVYKTGVPNPLKKYGGIFGYECALIPAGTI